MTDLPVLRLPNLRLASTDTPPGTIEKRHRPPLLRVIGTDTHPDHRDVLKRERFQVVSVADLFAGVVCRLLRC